MYTGFLNPQDLPGNIFRLFLSSGSAVADPISNPSNPLFRWGGQMYDRFRFYQHLKGVFSNFFRLS